MLDIHFIEKSADYLCDRKLLWSISTVLLHGQGKKSKSWHNTTGIQIFVCP